jgi:four helix bundle protein
MSQNLIDLEVWKRSRTFRKEISILVTKFPKEERFRLGDQLIRASRSVSANIAEGHGRFHFQENIQFCRQSRGSLVECFDHLTVALDQEYISLELFDELIFKYEELIKMLNGYISYLKKRKIASQYPN